MADSSYKLQELREHLRPFRLHWFPRLRSTNDHAANLRKRGELFAPAIVLSGRQTAGRGRAGNTWWSGAGCLTVTFAMAIEEHLSVHQLPLVAGLAARNAAAELTSNAEIALKWPNDLVYNGRKLAGLLCERIHRVDLIGLGMNINVNPNAAPPPLRRRITSLAAIAGRTFGMNDALTVIARHLRQMLSRRNQQPFGAILQEYDQHHALIGKQVKVLGANGECTAGECQGLDDMGRLVLRQGRQTHRVVTGHVEMVGA